MEQVTPRKLTQVVLHFRQWALQRDTSTKVLKNNGGYTIMVKRSKDGERYDVTGARCGKKDNFSRKVGLAICEGRMKCTRKPEVKEADLNLEQVLLMLTTISTKCHESYTRDLFVKLISKLG